MKNIFIPFIYSGHNRWCFFTSCKVHCRSPLTSCICAKLVIIAIALSAVSFVHLLSDNFHWFSIGTDLGLLILSALKSVKDAGVTKKVGAVFFA